MSELSGSGLFDWWARRLPLPRHREEIQETAEGDQPWIIYTYGRIHDGWWPLWRSSRVLGRAAIGAGCMICGKSRVIVARLPRFGPVPDRGKHPERVRFCLEHVHKDRPHPAAWARPLKNLNAWPKGLDLDLLAMRLEADLRRTDA